MGSTPKSFSAVAIMPPADTMFIEEEHTEG